MDRDKTATEREFLAAIEQEHGEEVASVVREILDYPEPLRLVETLKGLIQ